MQMTSSQAKINIFQKIKFIMHSLSLKDVFLIKLLFHQLIFDCIRFSNLFLIIK